MLGEPARRVLERYNARLAAEEERMRTGDPQKLMQARDEFLLPIGEQVAWFLHALIVARGAQRIVELGTSYGYSTLFLADAARRTGGRVATYELADYKQAAARGALEEAGLAAHVDWHCGDALALLGEASEPVDFVLIDLWKELYIPCFELLYDKLSDNAVIAADNMLEPEVSRPDAEAYRAMLRGMPDLQTVLLRIGSGIELSCVWRKSRREGGRE